MQLFVYGSLKALELGTRYLRRFVDNARGQDPFGSVSLGWRIIDKGLGFFERIAGKHEVVADSLMQTATQIVNMSRDVKTRFNAVTTVLKNHTFLTSMGGILAEYFFFHPYEMLLSILSMIVETIGVGGAGLAALASAGISFGVMCFLLLCGVKILGTVWNYILYISCYSSNCNIIEGMEYIELKKKACGENCWQQGVAGIGSIFIPEDITNEIVNQTKGSVIYSFMATLIDVNSKISKGRFIDIIPEDSSNIPEYVKFYRKGLNTIGSDIMKI
jgi:hypothetical protein